MVSELIKSGMAAMVARYRVDGTLRRFAIPNPAMARPEISPQTRVYNPFIRLIVVLPLLTVGLQLVWNPVFHYQYIGRGQLGTLDPASLYTPGYFLLLATGSVIYAVSVLLAYFDWRTPVTAWSVHSIGRGRF